MERMYRELEKLEGMCNDSDQRCGFWASQGDCTKNSNWMTKHCRKSCGKCVDNKVFLYDVSFCPELATFLKI